MGRYGFRPKLMLGKQKLLTSGEWCCQCGRVVCGCRYGRGSAEDAFGVSSVEFFCDSIVEMVFIQAKVEWRKMPVIK